MSAAAPTTPVTQHPVHRLADALTRSGWQVKEIGPGRVEVTGGVTDRVAARLSHGEWGINAVGVDHVGSSLLLARVPCSVHTDEDLDTALLAITGWLTLAAIATEAVERAAAWADGTL